MNDDNWKQLGAVASEIVAKLEDERRQAHAVLERYAAEAGQADSQGKSQRDSTEMPMDGAFHDERAPIGNHPYAAEVRQTTREAAE
jgi:hypothetical protein